MSSRRVAPRPTGVVYFKVRTRTCKVCDGKPPILGCWFCVDGKAKWGCLDCGGLMPLCACFGRYRQPVATHARSSR